MNTFEEIKKFNAGAAHTLRDYFTRSYFKLRDIEEFIERHSPPQIGDSVEFIAIPEGLSEIVTLKKPYLVSDITEDGLAVIYPDDEFTKNIPMEYLKRLPSNKTLPFV